MFCPNCGTSAADGAAFCPNCGTKLTAPEVPVRAQEETVILSEPEAPAYETQVLSEPETTPLFDVSMGGVEAPAAPETPAAPLFAQADFDSEPRKKKKRKEKKLGAPKSKKKLAITLGITGVLVAAAVTLTIVFWTPIAGFFVKTFGSPEDYFTYVEKQAAEDTADVVSTYYGTVVDNLTSGSMAAKGSMKLQVSDDLAGLFNSLGVGGGDLTWLNDATLNYSTAVDGDLYKIQMDLVMSQTKIIDFVMIMNMTTGEYYMGIPSLSSEYLHNNPSDYFVSGQMVAAANPYQMLSDEAFLKALPDEKTVSTLVERYLKVITENVGDVEKSSQTIQIGDLEQKVTALEYEVSQKDIVKMVKAVLKEAKNDKDLKKVIVNMSGYLESQGMIDDAEEIYPAFQELVEQGAAAMGMVSATNETVLVLTDYVNGSSEIIGRKLEIEGQTILEYVTLTKGKEFATEWDVAGGQVKFRGEGTVSGDVRQGDYKLLVQGTEMLKLSASYNEKKLKEGQLDGSFTLKPAAALLESMGLNSQVKDLINTMDLGLQLVISVGERDAAYSINLVRGNTVLLGLSADAQVTGDQSVSPPDSYMDINYADSWLGSLNLDKLISALEKTSIPAQIKDALISELEYMQYANYYY